MKLELNKKKIIRQKKIVYLDKIEAIPDKELKRLFNKTVKKTNIIVRFFDYEGLLIQPVT